MINKSIVAVTIIETTNALRTRIKINKDKKFAINFSNTHLTNH